MRDKILFILFLLTNIKKCVAAFSDGSRKGGPLINKEMVPL